VSSPARQSRAVAYVEALYGLLYPVGDFRPQDAVAPIAARVAGQLGVSRPAAGEMLGRLVEQGLIDRGPGGSLALTDSGIELAEGGIRATRILETFFIDYLGYEPAEVHALALQARDAFDAELLERLFERLGSPQRCPHGWPLGAAEERDETTRLQRLSELSAGDRCEVVGILESDAELVGWLFQAGLVPGTAVEVHDVQRAGGHATVGLGGRADDVVIGDRAARHVFVLPACG
jgi:DtxR family transcriptional regulator, Mn-dependent transcriptional regulator